MRERHIARSVLLLTILAGSATLRGSAPARPTHADAPETVLITLHVKPGAEAEAERILATHFETARRLDLALASPHLTMRGTESGNKAALFEIFTWRDASVPDAAPPAIQAIWSDMHAVVESRGGRPGLEIGIVSVVAQ
jgi:hypothetical protein